MRTDALVVAVLALGVVAGPTLPAAAGTAAPAPAPTAVAPGADAANAVDAADVAGGPGADAATVAGVGHVAGAGGHAAGVGVGGHAAGGPAVGAVAVRGPADTGGGAARGADLVTLTIDVRTDAGDPVDGATVNVTYDGGSNTTRTFSNGRALVDVPRGATVSIAVSHPDYVQNTPVTVADVGAGERVNVTVFPPSVAVVRVTDAAGPLENAEVALRKQSTGNVAVRGRTDENGVFRSPELEVGTYDVIVVKDFYRRETTELEATRGEVSTTVNLTEASVDVTVRVRDDHFETPEGLSGAIVTVRYDGETLKTARTGENGNTVINLGVNAQYTLQVTKEGYGTVERTILLGEEGRSFRFAIQRTPELRLSAVNNRVVAGESVLVRVRNAYGEPVAGATVTRNGTAVGTTDDGGELRVPVPEPGTYEIAASADGLSAGSVLVQGVEPATETTTTTPTPFTTTTSAPLPGFGAVLAVLAVGLVLAVLGLRRRR